MLKQFLIAFGIMGICLVLHIVGMVYVGDHLVRRRDRIERNVGPMTSSLVLIVVFSAIIALHLTEAGIWAVFYWLRGLFGDFETALYFSLKSYSTVGYGDVLLPHDFRLVGTIEGVSGVLLCGLSTAFLFTIVNTLFRFRTQQRQRVRLSDRGRARPAQPEGKLTQD